MSEKNLSKKMRKPGVWQLWCGNVKCHEDSLEPGVADLSFATLDAVDFTGYARHGWIELKYLVAFPKRLTTRVRCEHFTQRQRDWLREKGESAGSTYLFLQVGHEHFLFRWDWAVERFGEANETELRDNAIYTGGRSVDWKELGEVLATTL